MLGSNLTENKLQRQYKDQAVDVVYGNKSCLLWEYYEACVRVKYVYVLQQVVYTVTIKP
jgi:hypothetical protein